jgi:aspartate/glutamate racemase
MDRSEYYSTLQKEIAKQIPLESQRPTIDLQLCGTQIDTPLSCGIIGGIGPLSDAELLEQMIPQLRRLDNIRIQLFSSPPPRTWGEVLLNIHHYLANLYKFLQRDHNRVYIASNAAHANFEPLALLGKGNLINLTEPIRDRMASGENSHVCIVGSTLARETRLYEHLFEEKGLSYTRTTPEEQVVVQEEIDKVKAGQLQDDGERLFALLEAIIERNKKEESPVTHLLLACTELLMALRTKRLELECLGIQIVDSEQEFAAKIAEDLGA